MEEVLLKKIDLPEEYAKGLEDLLLKEQEDDRTSVDADIEMKRVAIAGSQAEAAKVRDVKRAEAQAAAQVIDGQGRVRRHGLHAARSSRSRSSSRVSRPRHARKPPSRMPMPRRKPRSSTAKRNNSGKNLLAECRSQPDSHDLAGPRPEQMQLQAAALKVNPLLVQLTVAQRLSDRVQIMMVPNDGKFFFANDALRSSAAAEAMAQMAEGRRSAPPAGQTAQR